MCRYWVLGAVGMVLARHWPPAGASGRCAAALTAAQVAMIVPRAAATLIFPRMVGESSVAGRATLLGASAVVAGVGLAAATAVALFAVPLVTDIFDPSYRPLAGVVIWHRDMAVVATDGVCVGMVTIALARSDLPGSSRAIR